MGEEKQRVLVVDDDPECRLMLAALAARAGYQVDAVADGQMALTMWRARPADIVLLDAHLPGIDGWEVCEAIKKSTNPRPVIMLTAFASDDARARSLRAGADQYVTKPFRADALLALIEHLLRFASSPPWPSKPTS